MYTEEDVQVIVRGYTESIKERFQKLLDDERKEGRLPRDEYKIRQLLGYAINQVKSDMSAKDAYERGGR